MLLHGKTRLAMEESKNLNSHPLLDDNDNDLLLGDDDLIDPNFQDFSDLPSESDEPPTTSSKNKDPPQASPNLPNNRSTFNKLSNSDNDSEQSYITNSSKENSDRFLSSSNNGHEISDFNQPSLDNGSKNPMSTKNLALKYNILSENKQNELVILQKLEYFLLKFKWNAKVQEITNNLVYPMKTILECDNSCNSKLNLTNLVVRIKQKTEKALSSCSYESNEFINEYLVKLIHLILSKHKCSPMCNELSLILIRNYFKQLELPEFSEDALNNIQNNKTDALMELLKKKLDIHLNEAHSCSSLVTLNQLSNIPINNETLVPESSSTSNVLVKETCKDVLAEGEQKNNSQVETRKDDFLDYNKRSNYSKQDENANVNYEDDFDEEELFFIKKECHEYGNSGYENSQSIVGMTPRNITDEYQFNDPNNDLVPAVVNVDKSDKDMYFTSSTSQQDQPYSESSHNPKSSSSNSNLSENETDRSKISPKSLQSDNNLILKAINKRKLQLACPICSSCVVNMSDHLVKKHSIKDRNERKYLMDLVRRTYLSIGKTNTPAQPPAVAAAALKPATLLSAPPILLPIQRQVMLSPTSPIQEKILAASLNNIIQNQQQSQLVQLAQNQIKRTDVSIQQNPQIVEQMNGQQTVYNNGVLSNEIIMSQENNKLSGDSNNVATNSNQVQAGPSSSPSMSSASNLPNTSNNSLNSNNNNNRKFIKCPICLDENKYFVNISDHLIKIHHLVTSEMRKPVLKQIKENSTLCINKSQFDLVYFSNLNKKIKLDQIANQMPLMSAISLKQADQEAQEQLEGQQQDQLSRVIQIQQIHQRAKNILSEALEKDSNEIIIDNLSTIFNASTAGSIVPISEPNEFDDKNLNKQPLSNKSVFKSKQKQILNNYEHECNINSQSPEQKTSSIANVYENVNDDRDSVKNNENFDRKDQNIDKENGNVTTNFLVTDEDIADYSDLINLNYEPLFSIKSSNSRPGLNYDSIKDWDFETSDLYVPSNLSSEDIVINGLFRYDDDNANSESIEFDEFASKRKQEENTSKLISFKRIRSEENTSDKYKDSSSKSVENEQHSSQENYSIKSEALSFKFTSPQNPVSQKVITSNTNMSNETTHARSVATPDSDESLFDDSSHFDNNSYKDQLNSQDKEESPCSDGSDQVKIDMWNKLNNLEENLNKTIKNFNEFTQNLMSQIHFFNDQFQSSISQINSLKNNLAELNGKTDGNSKSNPSS